MTVEELNKLIRSGKLCGIYFFYGEEQYLLNSKLDTIAKKLIAPGTEVFNLFKFEGKKVSASEVVEAVRQFPQMSEMKVVIVKNSEILNNATTADFKLLRSEAERIPSDTCLILTEQSFDKKKLKNISFIEENGGIVNFEFMPINKIEVWLSERFAKKGKSILDRDVRYIMQLCGQSLGKLTLESDKLLSYAADRSKITREDIDAVVVKTVEYRVYDMLDNIMAGNREKAQEQLKYLRDTRPDIKHDGKRDTKRDAREESLYILGLMMGQLSEVLMCKMLKEDGLSAEEISDYFDFKRPLFAVNKMIKESRRFEEKYLKQMIDKGLFYDLECKSGRLDPRVAIEMYLAELVN